MTKYKLEFLFTFMEIHLKQMAKQRVICVLWQYYTEQKQSLRVHKDKPLNYPKIRRDKCDKKIVFRFFVKFFLGEEE